MIKGTRLAAELILDLLANGWPHEQILANYPGVEPEEIRACLAYAREVLRDSRVFPLAPASRA